ncbi:MAG: hypothetical protein II260_07580 [Muribaculaceae bacterium]|nr:hypothetical protein [Muribaculaceae bacterium]
MKKFCSFVFMILIGASVSNAASWSYPSSAIEDPKGTTNLNIRDGSISKPYTISTAQELANFAYYVNNHSTGAAYKGKYIELLADIVLNDWVINENGEINTSAQEWTPIGEYGTFFNDSFEGTFLGNGHTISGVYVNTERSYNGLFGDLKYGSIKDLHIKDSYIANGSKVTGGLVAHVHGDADSDQGIENCSFEGIIVSHSSKNVPVGGIAGLVHSEIEAFLFNNCSVSGKIVDSNNVATYLGGVCGNSGCEAIQYINCSNNMTITGGKSDAYIGGVAGNGSVFKNCVNNMPLQSNNAKYVGGIAGQADSIFNSENKAIIIGKDKVGGVAGATKYISASTNNATVIGNGTVGGVAGEANRALECINYADITNNSTGNGYTGGVVGYSSIQVNDCVNNSSLISSATSGTSYTGGVAGYVAKMERCYNFANVTNSGAVSWIGGVIGYAGEMTFCGNMGDVNATGKSSVANDLRIGGVAGCTRNALFQCFNHGDVTSAHDALCAGVSAQVGMHIANSYIANCFNVGMVQNGQGYGIAAELLMPNISFVANNINTIWLSGTAKQGYPKTEDINYTEKSRNIFTDDIVEGNAFDMMADATKVIWGSYDDENHNGYPIPRSLGGKLPYFYKKYMTGTESDPYYIYTIADFKVMANVIAQGDDCANEYFKQLVNLDFTDVEDLQPVGVNYNISIFGDMVLDLSEGLPFAGTYDGNMNTIKGIRYNNPTKLGTAIFYENKGTIKNLIIDDYANSDNYESAVANVMYAGILTNKNGGTINNVIVKNSTVTSNKGIAGTIAASCSGTIENASVFNTTVKGKTIGGIVGVSENGQVISTTSAATLDACEYDRTNGGRPYIGGIAGVANGISINNCYFECDTSKILFEYTDANDCPYIGGAVGYGENGGGDITIKSFVAPWNEVYPNVLTKQSSQAGGYFGALVGVVSKNNTTNSQVVISSVILDKMNTSHDWWGVGDNQPQLWSTQNMTFRWDYNMGSYERNDVEWDKKHFNSNNLVQGYHMVLPLNTPTTYQVRTTAKYTSAVVAESDRVEGSVTYLDMTARKAIDNTIFFPVKTDGIMNEFYDLPNVCYNGSTIRNLHVVDGKDLTCSGALTAENISFERKNVAGWTTLCLPFNISQDMLPENAIFEEVIGIDAEKGEIYTQTTSSINAGEPFLLYCEDEDFVISMYKYNNPISISTAVVQDAFYGTFTNTDIASEYFVLDESGESFVRTENGNVLPFNAYLLDENLAKFESIKVVHNPMTLVEEIEVEENAKKVIYDIYGRRVFDINSPGIYIINGKKTLVK